MILLRPIEMCFVLWEGAGKIVYRRFVDHLEINGLLPFVQSAFRKHYRTVTALTKITYVTTKQMAKLMIMSLCLLNYTKPFVLIY